MTGLGISNDQKMQRRREDDALAGAPWPVRAVVVIGVTGAIACYLVYVLADDVRGYQRRTEPLIQSHVEATGGVVSGLKEMEIQHQISNRRMERLLRLLCQQGAKTRIERTDCDPE